MNTLKARHERLERFNKKYVGGEGEPFGYFMSLEAVLDNADTDVELIKLGFFDSSTKSVEFDVNKCPDCKSEKLEFDNEGIIECLGCGTTMTIN